MAQLRARIVHGRGLRRTGVDGGHCDGADIVGFFKSRSAAGDSAECRRNAASRRRRTAPAR
ncbi:hypothetical protein [Lysobacter gummosus]|uniref:hypothetical protein n=1 Tax=Lysobacter gummosus TaxID=262324 RepID=UPI00363FC0E3